MGDSAATRLRFRIAFAAVVLAGVIGCLTATDEVCAQAPFGTWTMQVPLPAARAEVAAVALDGKLYALGGVVNNKSVADHDAYDPQTNVWRAAAPLPQARDHLALAVAGGKIYAFGGFATPVHKDASNAAFAYDPARNAWQILPPMPTPRGAAGAALVDGKIHVIGGRGPDGAVVAAHVAFDIRSGTWSAERRG